MVITRQFITLGRISRNHLQIGEGKNLYDFIYGGNAAEGHLLAAKELLRAAYVEGNVPQTKRVDGEAFNLTNGEPWHFWDVARFVSTAAGYPVQESDVWKFLLKIVCFFMAIWGFVYWIVTLGGEPEVKGKMLQYTAQVRTFDITKARQRLGYEPRVSIEEELRRGVEWHAARDQSAKKSK